MQPSGPDGLEALDYFTYIGCQTVFYYNNTVTPGYHVVGTNELCAQTFPHMMYIATATYPCTGCTPPFNDTYCYGSMTNYGTVNDAPTSCTAYCAGNANEFCGGWAPGFRYSVFMKI